MIDLTACWDRIGKKFAEGLMNRIFRQQGIDGKAFPPPKSKTIGSRKFRTKKVAGQRVKSQKRLWVTGNFANQFARSYAADATGVWVYADDKKMHPGGITYAWIVRRNSRNFPGVNTNIDDPPMIFPRTAQEVGAMQKEVEFARYELKKALTEHYRQLLTPEKREIVIGQV